MIILKQNNVGFLLLVSFILFLLLPLSALGESMIGFGDSITQGLWMVQEPGNGRRIGGYEPFLEQLFSSVDRPVAVYNYGLAGETTLQALISDEESPRTIDSVLAGHNADYVLIMEGTNDFFFGIDPETTAFNLGVMVDRSRRFNVVPVLATLTPDPRGTDKDIPKTNSLIRQKAAEKNVLLVDHYKALVGIWDSCTGPSDRLHPNEDGYMAMAKVWFESFLNLKLETLEAVVSIFSAELHGAVSANGIVSGLAFEFGTEPTALGQIVQASPQSSSGSGVTEITAEIDGLKMNSTYYYRLIAKVAGRTRYGELKTLTTPLPLPWLGLLFNSTPTPP